MKIEMLALHAMWGVYPQEYTKRQRQTEDSKQCDYKRD